MKEDHDSRRLANRWGRFQPGRDAASRNMQFDPVIGEIFRVGPLRLRTGQLGSTQIRIVMTGLEPGMTNS